MTTNSDVTIIIPTYCWDEESISWAHQAVSSALSQKCKVAVYDDASPVEPVFLKDMETVRYVRGRLHKGVSYARNMAASLADTELILPLDGDDIFVTDAVSTLLRYWDGNTPVYPDISKFGIENDSHYELLDFHCDHILNHVGFASVNVLHRKANWIELGGWDEGLEFYEDGWYNAQLFSRHCGRRCPKPLVGYRMHPKQRTKLYASRAAEFSKLIMDRIRRLDMACSSCSKSRSARQAGNPVAVVPSPTVDPSSLPGELDGRVLVQYIGGQGKAKHYYQGPVTKFMYKVTYGDWVYADLSDITPSSLFKRYSAPPAAPQPAASIVPAPIPQKVEMAAPKPVERKPVKPVERKPV